MNADPWGAYLRERRAAHRQVVDRIAKRGWTSADDAWDEFGPMGLTEWSAAQASGEVLRLVAFAEAMAALAEGCERERAESPVVTRVFVARKIREGLAALTNESDEGRHDD